MAKVLRVLRRVAAAIRGAYTTSPRFWNGTLVLVALGGATLWILIYTDWKAAILAFSGLVITYAGLVAATFYRKKKDGSFAIPSSRVSSPWWLLVPATIIGGWMLSLLWATVRLEVVDEKFQSVVIVRELGGHHERREAPLRADAAVIRVPVWSTSSYDIGTRELTAREFELNRWRVNRIFLPDDIRRFQIYFKPTTVLSKTAMNKGWRLRIVKDGKALATVAPYSGEGIVVGGADGTGLVAPKDSTIRYEARSVTLTDKDIVHIFVEFPNGNETWGEYVHAYGSPDQKPGTREVEFDAPP